MTKNIPQLPFDMISKILNIRMKTKKSERELLEWSDDWKDNFILIENQLDKFFIKERAKYNNTFPRFQVESAILLSSIQALDKIKESNAKRHLALRLGGRAWRED